jgi:hydrophobe/amphiphile efflux-1 (HAE1) family protein
VLAQQISQIAGVAQVAVGGQQKPAIRVQVDPARLAAMGMTLEDVRGVIAQATVDSPKGSIQGNTQALTVYANDQITAASDYNNIILAYRNGAPVHIGDIGHAVAGPQSQLLAGWQSGRRGIQLMVFKQPGANVIDTVDRVKAALPRLQASIPPSVHVSTIIDRTLTIRASVSDVEFTLALSIALVVMVIFLFLRSFWATVIPSLTVPVALIGTLGAMYLCGYSLDNLSLMGLTIAVGFVVDDAIVMLENIYRLMEEDMDPMQAALSGAGQIGFTIVSISASLIAVFIPLLLMGGIVGRLFREFAVTVSITIVVSAIVSLTLTPMLCARFLRHDHGAGHGRLYQIVERGFAGMLNFYERTLDVALRWRKVTLGVFVATVAVTAGLFIAIPKGFFPTQDTGIIVGISEAAQSVSFDEMARIQQALGAVIGADPAVQSYSSTIGAGTGGQTANNGRFYINLKPWEDRADTATQVIARLERNVAGIQGARLFLQPAQDVSVGGRLARTMYQYTLQDSDAAELNTWAPQILDTLRKMPALTSVATDQQVAGSTATLVVDRARAQSLGIQPQQIDDVLYDAFGERRVTQYFTQVSSYYVVLEVLPELTGDPHTLDKLFVKSGTGSVVPLSSFTHIDTRPVQPLAVNHQAQFPAVTISFNLAPGVSLGDAVAAITAAQQSMGVPASLQGSFQGTAQAFQSSLSSEPYLIAAALASVYIILGVLYESYILPLTILSTLPSAGVGALLMLMAFGTDLSVIALIGIILLIGIVKKNGIMMVDFAINAERGEGAAPLQAIRQACLMRFRPILMTTMAALLSGLPLMLESGAGSELRKPLGIAMVGGLALSQVLTLYTTPVIYLWLDRLQAALSRRPQRAPSLARALGQAGSD